MSSPPATDELPLPYVIYINDIPLRVAIFDDVASRQQGLMEVTYLPESSGGLFMYDKPNMVSFWMKNTPMPLDMLFFNARRQLIQIAQNTQPCMVDDCPLYQAANTQYVVEVPAGFVAANHIKLNAILTID
ncbi:DUF192 domain-containing protein [Thiolinea disciformis]|uniref:DUF192 domain-containing protein n=1 Tax=Thiolinea disciformis TaxID=125614 RepID=UPI0012FF16FA|nr:DUF192 domain-containing protein [Thiolinea disciformis]